MMIKKVGGTFYQHEHYQNRKREYHDRRHQVDHQARLSEFLAQFHAEEISGCESEAVDLMLVSYFFRGRLKVSSSSAIWKIAAVTALALGSLAAETARRRNRNRRKCTTKRSVSSMRTLESVFESPVGPAVEQTAETLRPSVPQTPEIAPALAAVPMPPEAARLTEPSDEEIRLRAYFISEHRRRFALPGDADSDWREAKQQLLSK